MRADWRFIHEYYTGMCAHLLERSFGAEVALHEPETIVTFEDHLSYVHRSPMHVNHGLLPNVRALSRAHRAFAARYGLAEHGYLQPQLDAGDSGNTGSQGISHALMAEGYALPGQLIVGTDSHTPHSGALGCVAFGVGTTDIASAFVTGAVRLAMPQVLRVEVDEPLQAGVTAKDLVLHLLALPSIRAGAGVGKVFEFGGAGVRALGIDERATLTNMTAELGGFTGIVEPDAGNRALPEGAARHRLPTRAVDEERCRRRLQRRHPHRCGRAVADGRAARRPRQRRAAERDRRAPAHRHRLRRLVHRRQARGLRPVPRGAVVGR